MQAGNPAFGAGFQSGDVVAALIGEKRLVAVPVDIGEAQLGAGVRALAADDQPSVLGPRAELDLFGQLGDPGTIARTAIAVQRRPPFWVT